MCFYWKVNYKRERLFKSGLSMEGKSFEEIRGDRLHSIREGWILIGPGHCIVAYRKEASKAGHR